MVAWTTGIIISILMAILLTVSMSLMRFDLDSYGGAWLILFLLIMMGTGAYGLWAVFASGVLVRDKIYKVWR